MPAPTQSQFCTKITISGKYSEITFYLFKPLNLQMLLEVYQKQQLETENC